MLCTWLLAALVATGPAILKPSSAPGPNKAFARLFRFGSDNPKTGVDIICGMTVIRKSPHIDPGIALPANRSANIAVRRIEPRACGASQRVRPK
jgi:hypothetical protein